MDDLLQDMQDAVDFHSGSYDDRDTMEAALKLLREFRTAAQSLIDGDPTLDPSELIEKHRAWFRELIA